MFDLCGVARIRTDAPEDYDRGNVGAKRNITHRKPLYSNAVGGPSVLRDKHQLRLLSEAMLEP